MVFVFPNRMSNSGILDITVCSVFCACLAMLPGEPRDVFFLRKLVIGLSKPDNN